MGGIPGSDNGTSAGRVGLTVRGGIPGKLSGVITGAPGIVNTGGDDVGGGGCRGGSEPEIQIPV